MAHTVSGSFRFVRVNSRPAGEPDLFAIRAGELGVPIGMISGDQVVAAELSEIAPQVETAVIKQALSNFAARCIPPERAQPLIATAAQRAVTRAANGELQPYTADSSPYQIEVELREPVGDGLRANIEAMDEFELTGEHTVSTVAPDMDLGFRRIAYLGYGDRKGLTRY